MHSDVDFSTNILLLAAVAAEGFCKRKVGVFEIGSRLWSSLCGRERGMNGSEIDDLYVVM